MLRGSSVCTPQPWSTFAEKTEFTKGNLVSIYLIAAGLCLLGILYINRRLRLYLLQEKEKNEEMYRDGGRKSPGIIICYLVSQMSWYSSLFFSSRSTARYGISGAVYSALAGALAVSLMAPLAVQLKTKAPGARTFLQVIYARFGKWPHILFCTIALTINVTALLTLLTRATRGLIQNTGVTSEEVVLAVFIFVVGMGLTYGGISGIYTAAYIYVGFFLWFSLVLGCAVFLDPAKFPLGSFENIYDLINCQIGPEGNYNQSFLTFRSTSSALDTIEEFGTSLVYTVLDQSYWQAIFNSDPESGGFSILAAALIWFPMPAVFGTACGLGYLALNMAYGMVQLSAKMEEMGLMVNLVSQSVFGDAGRALLNIVILSAMATTTTAEVASISNIFINDIYATYLNPFCKRIGLNSCILCGKLRARFAEDSERCKCGSMAACERCEDDMRAEETSRRAVKPPPTCSTHALYRRYLEQTRKLKFWITFTILGIVLFLALAVELAQVVSMSLMTYVSIFGASAVGSLYLTFYWARLNSLAVLVGILSGTVFGIAGILITHFTKLSFMGLGTAMSLLAGFIAPVIVTLVSAKKLTEESELDVWEETRAIDNPLQPWPEIYAGDLGLRNAHLLTEGRPRLDDVQRAFGFSSTVLSRCVISVVLLFLVIMPAAAAIPASLNYQMFQAWMHILLIWLSGSAIFCLIMPIVFEVENIYLAYKRRQEAERPDSFKAGQSATFAQGIGQKVKSTYATIMARIGEFDNETGLLEAG